MGSQGTAAAAAEAEAAGGGVVKAAYFDPTKPPTQTKRMIYRIYVACILLLEVKLVCKQRSRYEEYLESNSLLIHRLWMYDTMWPFILVHLLIDAFMLFHLNAIHPKWGVTKHPHLKEPVLRISEENSILIRHCLKMLIRFPPIGAPLVGAKIGYFHAFTCAQALSMSLSPTVFGTLLAVRSMRGLLIMCLCNVLFMVGLAVSLPFSHIVQTPFSPTWAARACWHHVVIGAPLAGLMPLITHVAQKNYPAVKAMVCATVWRVLSGVVALVLGGKKPSASSAPSAPSAPSAT
eukprot:CAMPEP_0197591084 /NCGR_PEP_ID=MMETSP1326-20131121/12791_1 /TAXON_ID=1155430 /ORGANISM="Genus nov. species nov., Strain RCC2288" /LENGTH=290 /DNA_ID=CAMNT_0043156437 /DNA_START=237 /DNA_END=1105 /DNA_ORIENTATION=+